MIILAFLILLSSEADILEQMVEQPEKIEIIYQQGLKQYPDSYRINTHYGAYHLKKKQFQKALTGYREAYRVYPDIGALLGITYAQLMLKQYQALIQITDRYVAETKYPHLWILMRRQIAFFYTKQYQQVLDIGERLPKNQYDNLINCAYARYYMGDYAGARAGFQQIYQQKRSPEIKRMIQLLTPKLRWWIDPVGGAVSYSDSVRENLTFWGANGYLSYDHYLVEAGFNTLTITYNPDLQIDDYGQWELDGGFGWDLNRKNRLHLHLKYINADMEWGAAFYGKYTYRLKRWRFGGEGSFTYFSQDQDLATLFRGSGNKSSFNIYQLAGWGGYHWNSLYLEGKIGYKYSAVKGFDNTFFIEGSGFYQPLKQFFAAALIRYNQKTYLVSGGGFSVDNANDPVRLYTALSFGVVFRGITLGPYYNHYLLKGGDDKYGYGLQIGYRLGGE